jgi:Fe-S-cluster containining protein
MDAEILATKARKSINRFCFEECNAYCCRKGYLVLTKEESELVTQEKLIYLLKNKIIKKTDSERYALQINPCAALKDNKCMIHNNSDRPKVCNDFPLFLWANKIIHVSNRCLFVKQGLLYPYLAKFKIEGYKLSYDE